MMKKRKTDWDRVDHMTDDDIAQAVAADPDAAPLDPDFWNEAVVVHPKPKPNISIRLDPDIIAYFKGNNPKGYQKRINAVLRAYMNAMSKEAG